MELPAARAPQAEAQALSEQPNYWLPLEALARQEGGQPRPTAAERAVRHLYRALVAERLAGDPRWRPGAAGAEYWVQVYRGGRGLGFHFDKDEAALRGRGEMRTPLWCGGGGGMGGGPNRAA